LATIVLEGQVEGFKTGSGVVDGVRVISWGGEFIISVDGGGIAVSTDGTSRTYSRRNIVKIRFLLKRQFNVDGKYRVKGNVDDTPALVGSRSPLRSRFARSMALRMRDLRIS